MADYLTTDTELASIANAIRTKGGTSAQLVYPAGFVSAIEAIPTGGGGLQWTEHIDPNDPIPTTNFYLDSYLNTGDSSTVWTARVENCYENTLSVPVESGNHEPHSGIIDIAGIGLDVSGSLCSSEASYFWIATFDSGSLVLYQINSDEVGGGDLIGDFTSFKTLG